MSLYGCCLWLFNSSSINVIEIALLRKIWHLHPRSHTGIVHCVSQLPTVSNMLYHWFTGFLSTALLSSSTIVRYIFNESMYFHLLVTISYMVSSILRLSVSLILILVVLLDKFAVIMVFVLFFNLY